MTNTPYLSTNFPYIQVLVIAGFLLILLLDQVLFKPGGVDIHKALSEAPNKYLAEILSRPTNLENVDWAERYKDLQMKK